MVCSKLIASNGNPCFFLKLFYHASRISVLEPSLQKSRSTTCFGGYCISVSRKTMIESLLWLLSSETVTLYLGTHEDGYSCFMTVHRHKCILPFLSHILGDIRLSNSIWRVIFNFSLQSSCDCSCFLLINIWCRNCRTAIVILSCNLDRSSSQRTLAKLSESVVKRNI